MNARITTIGLLIGSLSVSAFAETPAKLRYNRDVRPILAENCFACHGFDEHSREADLRLDVAESAVEDRGGYFAIVAGDPANSEVWKRISSEDEYEVMPPPDSHRELTYEQKSLIQRWILEGAEYEDHWSFVPPRKPDLPAITNESWPRNEIDRFVLARLEAEGLKPSPEAERGMLLRRLSLDLTGLPPSAEEVDEFIEDDDPNAYERAVDRLLASPHFGERMALDWLDAARYADTNGYSIDGGRHMWLWRDWVIDAFNRNLPYDQFLREQMAGDLLPEPSPSQRIATGFQRNNMVTHEGGTIPEENLTNYNADRVKTLGEAVLGLTVGCAQCHDHKYDPITQRDYYRLFAYFNSVSDIGLDGNGGVNPRPFMQAKTVLQTGEEEGLRKKIESLRRQLASPDEAAVAKWEADQRRELEERGVGMELHKIKPLHVSTPNAGAGYRIEEDRFVAIERADAFVPYDVSLQLPQLDRPMTGLRVVFHPHSRAPESGWGFGTIADGSPAKGTFMLTAVSASAESVPGDQVNLHRLLGVRRVTASSWESAHRPEEVLDTRNDNGWSPAIDREGPVHITITFDEPLDTSALAFLTVQLNFGHGRKLVGTQFEFQALTGNDDGSTLPEDILAILKVPASDRTSDQREALFAYFSAHAQATQRLRTSLANLEERLATLTQEFPTMVMDRAEKPRETFILNRGDYSQPGEKVTAGTPEFLPSLPEEAALSRLGLAEWTTMRENPLTARVAVNRIWQLLFGVGIVATPADFGTQGEWPSHPELLDVLSVDFVESGWDTKALVKNIVMSATYRQDSSASEELLKLDPQNRLLAHGPRFRLSAELIRDSALKMSGLLVPWIGGPSVNPYTPGDLWREVSHYGSTPATAQTFVQDRGEKLYRRSLYTYWKRTVPPPNMAAFDAPNREVCTVSRAATTTPLQALVLLNDVQFVEASRAFAERIIKQSEGDEDRLRWAFRECLSRSPSDAELSVLERMLDRERVRYRNDPAAAGAYLANGEAPRDESIPPEEHAAWAQVAALLFNLSETVTRN